jgi:hypothetical protein
MKLELLVGAKQSTFTSEAAVSQRGEAVESRYQWQRNDGAGWVNIPGAVSASFQITPTQVDMKATFRVMVTPYAVPGKVIYSNVVKLLTEPTTPTISISRSGGGVSITFTGKLVSATNAQGPYTEVVGAQSPYPITTPTGTVFYRSVK